MTAVTPLDALVIEAAALTHALRSLPGAAWARPTRCRPWDARALLAHVRVAVARVPQALAEPVPAAAEVSAVQYYRPDERFSPATNADRVATAQAQASDLPGPAILAELDGLRGEIVDMCAAEPPDRVVRTRHGDAMLLTEFLKTRVLEVAVHGFDLADAVGRPSWLTTAAADVLQDLLLGPARTATDPEPSRRATTGPEHFPRAASDPEHIPRAASDPEHFLRAATGRATDPDLLARLRSRPLALG